MLPAPEYDAAPSRRSSPTSSSTPTTVRALVEIALEPLGTRHDLDRVHIAGDGGRPRTGDAPSVGRGIRRAPSVTRRGGRWQARTAGRPGAPAEGTDMLTVLATLRLLRAVSRALLDPATRGVVLLALVLLAGGTPFYVRVEGWSVIDALYFCVVLLTTVGFGDLVPSSEGAKVFTMSQATRSVAPDQDGRSKAVANSST